MKIPLFRLYEPAISLVLSALHRVGSLSHSINSSGIHFLFTKQAIPTPNNREHRISTTFEALQNDSETSRSLVDHDPHSQRLRPGHGQHASRQWQRQHHAASGASNADYSSGSH